MEEKGLDFTKPPLDLSPPIDRSVPRCCLLRQIGYKQKKTLVPNELQWAAEDSMINRSHEEFKCHLPDISRSTFLMVFSPDGKKVASTHGNHNVYVTDLTSGKNIKTLTGHPRTPWCIAFHPSSNQILASGCLGGQVRVWDLHGGSEIWTAESQTVIASLAFHPVDRMLVIASYNELHFWDWSQPEPFAKCYTANEKEKVRYVAFDHLGHKLITGVANAPARTTSQWDRVSVPQPPPQVSTLESERRITICYRYMVEQYEHLVQHYYDLSRRARTTPTMDRGTDPMDLEAESSHSSVSGTAPSTSNTPQPTLTSRLASRILDRLHRRPETNQTTSTANDSDSTRNPFNSLFLLPNRRIGNPQSSQTPSMPEERERPQRVAAGTDETSASRSSTQFLLDNESSNIRSSELPSNTGTFTPINFLGNNMERTSDALESMRSWVSSRCPPNSESRLNNQRSPTSTDRGLSTFSNLSLRPSEVNPRNNSDLPHPPSFNSRQRNSPTATTNNPLSRYQQIHRSTAVGSSDQPTPNRPLSGLSPETIGFGLRRETETTPPESNSNSSPILRGSIHRVRQLVEDLLGPRRRRNLSEESTDMNPVDSDNEAREEPPPTPQSEDEHSLSSLMNYFDRHSCSRQASPTGSRSTTPPPPRRGSDTTSSTAVSRLRTQFRRLQTAYHSRSPTHSSHVLSAESQAAERRLLNRLNEILERPLEPRARRFLISRRSAFQFRPSPATTNNPRPPTTNSSTSTSPALDISGVRYGIELLSRHIDNMQRLCRARLEILQLQQIRRMWEDLQSQIYALHGVVRDNNGNRPEPAPESGSRSETEATPRRHRPSAPSEAPDVLTDDDSDGANNDDLQWRPSGAFRRAPQQRIGRRYNKLLSQQNTRSFLKRPRSSGVNRPKDGQSRNSHFQFYHAGRRQTSTRTSSSQQATTSEELPSERGEASSSHVSGETSTGTGTSEEQPSVRGVKRKSRDSDSLFRPRPSTSVGTGPSTSSQQPSSLVSSMRDTIMQLESMVWRARARTAQRNFRLSRFTRQREERMLRNLWDTESSHESSRDDQSEGDSSQPSGNAEPTGETDWTRESTRLRARQVLLLMVDSLTQFFENDSLSRRTSNEALHERIYNLYVLLQLALNLTDLLLAQLVSSRRELEYRRHSSLPLHLGAENDTWGSRYVTRSRHIARHLGRSPETWRRSFRRNTATAPPDTSQSTTPSTPSAPTENRDREQREPVRRASTTTVGGGSRGLPHRHHAVYSNIRNTMISRLSVPVVRVNGLPVPPVENNPPPRPRPHSPPPYPIGGSSPILTPRFLHPRYVGPNPFDESTSEDSSPQDRSDYSLFLRAGYGSSSIILNDTPMSPHHRIQAWDFSKYNIPDISNADKNIVVSECKIHNDASVDVSNDGRLLVTLLPSGRLSITTMLGVYSLQWETLGQLLYTTSFEQNAVSVSLSPTTRHLVVGLASRRVALVNNDRYTNAQVYRLEGATPGCKLPLGARGVLVHIRDLELSRNFGFMSLNCIRWAPNPGQGLVYGTNTGQLKILR